VIGVEMNADYEHALMMLLAGEGDFLVLESDVARRELREELQGSNPNTGLYRDFAAADVRLNPRRIPADVLDPPSPGLDRDFVPRPRFAFGAEGRGHEPAAERAQPSPESAVGSALEVEDTAAASPSGEGARDERVADAVDERDAVDEPDAASDEVADEAPSRAPEPAAPGAGAPADTVQSAEPAGATATQGESADPGVPTPPAAVDEHHEAGVPGGPSGDDEEPGAPPPGGEPLGFDEPEPPGSVDEPADEPLGHDADIVAFPLGARLTVERGGGGGGGACQWCAEALPDRPVLNYCPHCGGDLRLAPCAHCGEELEPGWRFCPACGHEAGA